MITLDSIEYFFSAFLSLSLSLSISQSSPFDNMIMFLFDNRSSGHPLALPTDDFPTDLEMLNEVAPYSRFEEYRLGLGIELGLGLGLGLRLGLELQLGSGLE
jgi:hypothetical protein